MGLLVCVCVGGILLCLMSFYILQFLLGALQSEGGVGGYPAGKLQ